MQATSEKEFLALSIEQKIPFLNHSGRGRFYHVLFAQQFDRQSLNLLCRVADKARKINKDRDKGRRFLRSLLFGTCAINFFSQPSTRTFLSFQTAQETLGMGIRDIRDPSTSSEAKGETLEDSIRTFSSYVDLMVMRHPAEGAAERGAWVLNQSDRRIPIINGGSGKDQHPTQALLDIYTLYKSFNGEIDGKTIAMVGDLNRGRTVRSLSYLMKNYQDIKLIFVAPEHLRMRDDIKEFLRKHSIPFEETDNLEEVVSRADAIYMTRIQDEWDKKEGLLAERQTAEPRFCFKKEYLGHMKECCVLMHPLPKRDEIEVEVDYCGDRRVVYWRQERNGMWIRVALIAAIFGKDSDILNY